MSYLGIIGVLDCTSTYLRKTVYNNGVRFVIELTDTSKLYVGYIAVMVATMKKKLS